jgi:hypothetical protein
VIDRKQGGSASSAFFAKFREDARGSRNGFCRRSEKSIFGGLSRVIADVIGGNDVLSAVSALDLGCFTGLTAAIASAELPEQYLALEHCSYQKQQPL